VEEDLQNGQLCAQLHNAPQRVLSTPQRARRGKAFSSVLPPEPWRGQFVGSRDPPGDVFFFVNLGHIYLLTGDTDNDIALTEQQMFIIIL
jgi:hypothetical protein